MSLFFQSLNSLDITKALDELETALNASAPVPALAPPSGGDFSAVSIASGTSSTLGYTTPVSRFITNRTMSVRSLNFCSSSLHFILVLGWKCSSIGFVIARIGSIS